MEDSELERKIQESLKEGFKKEEIEEALIEDGYQKRRIRKLFDDLNTGFDDQNEPKEKYSSTESFSTQSRNEESSLEEKGNYESAGLFKRCIAVFLDGIPVGILAGIFFYLFTRIFLSKDTLNNLNSMGSEQVFQQIMGPLLTAMIVVPPVSLLVYYTVVEGYMSTSLGKSLLGMKVVNLEGEDISWKKSSIRNFIRLFDILPNFYTIGGIASILGDTNKRLGDYIACTKVVEKN